jgi:hypothetical protein
MPVNKFHAILVEGLFYMKGSELFVEQFHGRHVAFDEILDPVVDLEVQIALHHFPPHGIQPDLPGAGSCRWHAGINCPVQHDIYPDRLLSFHMAGVLRKGPWRVEKFNGSVPPLPLVGMPGHYGRIGAASIVDVEKMREALAKMSPEAMMEAMSSAGVNAEELEAMLAGLRKAGPG